ncbi:MAG: O-antigen ligase family protein [Nitrospirae bacterium]|nr:O-antigen ligase family protein [Nitrospirota bacterium]
MSFFKLPAVMKSIVVFILMVNMIKNRETALFSLKTLILITALSAIIGILQEIIFFYKGIEIAGVIQEDVKRFMWQETPFGTLMRVPAFTSWYTILANHLSIALIVGINFILYSILTKKKEKLFLYIAMILMSIALYFTFSYSSILIVLSAFIFSIMLRWISLKIYVTLFFVILLLGFFSGFIPDFLADPKKYFMTEDLSIRIELLRDGITGFLNRHPFIGNGVGTGHKYTSNIDLWPVHNNFVLIADEIGLFGLLTYCIFFFAFIFRQVMSISKIKNTKDRAIALSLIIAFIAYLINLQLQAQHIDFFIFLYLGLIEAIISTLSSQTAVEISAKRKV